MTRDGKLTPGQADRTGRDFLARFFGTSRIVFICRHTGMASVQSPDPSSEGHGFRCALGWTATAGARSSHLSLHPIGLLEFLYALPRNFPPVRASPAIFFGTCAKAIHWISAGASIYLPDVDRCRWLSKPAGHSLQGSWPAGACSPIKDEAPLTGGSWHSLICEQPTSCSVPRPCRRSCGSHPRTHLRTLRRRTTH